MADLLAALPLWLIFGHDAVAQNVLLGELSELVSDAEAELERFVSRGLSAVGLEPSLSIARFYILGSRQLTPVTHTFPAGR